MATDPPVLLAVAEARYWPMRCLATRSGAASADVDDLVEQAWLESKDLVDGAGPDERAVSGLLRRLRELEGGGPADAHPAAVPPSWFNPEGHRWAGWWDREPFDFDLVALGTEATRSAIRDAVAELALAARTVLVLHDMAGWAPGTVRRLLGLDAEHHLALLHAARSHVRRALERMVDPADPQPPGARAPSVERDLVDYDISCSRLTGLATNYLEGAIQPRLRTTFEEHLVVCPPCVAHVSQLRATVLAIQGLGRSPAPEAALERLAAALAAD